MKNWLIRTQNKQLLGPVTKEKILELLAKNALREEDELCSGNGYWFYIKEKHLIEKYINENAPQPFNPISEAKDVLGVEGSATGESEESEVENTLVLDLSKTSLNEPSGQEELSLPQESDLEYPSMSTSDEDAVKPKDSEVVQKKK